MGEDLFEGLPPPSSSSASPTRGPSTSVTRPPLPSDSAPAPALKSALKSSLKRDKPDVTESSSSLPPAPPEVSGKRLRFKTTVDASEVQVIEAMKKIASHIAIPSKFCKASKLALQLIQAGSVKPGTSNHFFSILEAAMSSLSACNEPSLRADYQALFIAAQDVIEHFDERQRNDCAIWTLRAVLENELLTDDSFVFSKAVGKVKDAISGLPLATTDDDNEEAAELAVDEKNSACKKKDHPATSDSKTETFDPSDLDGPLPNKSKKPEYLTAVHYVCVIGEDVEAKKLLKRRREVLLKCLETAARRYRLPWTQTAIDILAKHAYDHIDRFTRQQRDAIEKLWSSIKDQHVRRKQGKSVNGKLDMTAFEWLQDKYSNQKISIRHAVGGDGDRRATQWLG